MSVERVSVAGVWSGSALKVFVGSAWKLVSGSGGASGSVLSTLRHIGGQTMRTGRVTTSRTAASTYLSNHVMYAQAKDIQLVYGGNLPAGVTMPIRAAIVLPDGTRHLVTWSGVSSATLSGETSLVSDEVPVTVAADTLIAVYTYYGARSDGLAHPGAPGGWYDAEILAGDQVETGVARTDTSLQYDGYNGYRPVMPHAILGLTTSAQTSVALLGDSITESGAVGQILDPVKSVDPRGTYSQRALETVGIPNANLAYWGSTYATSRAGVWGSIPDLSLFTHAIVAWGYNDLNQSAQLATDVTVVMQKAVDSWSWVASECPNVYQTTITPNTTSTDGWTTLAAQTLVASAGRRTAFNGWLRDGAPIIGSTPTPGTTDPTAVRAGQAGHPLKGVLEIADTIMSARNSEKFRVDQGSMTADGGHPNLAGHVLMMPPVQVWAENLTAS